MALRVDLVANTRQFQSEMRKTGEGIDDISDALDDVARDGARDGQRLERTFREIASEARRTDDSVRDIGDTSSSSFRKMGDNAAEVGDELRANLGETFSSFRGDLQDLPQIAQDTLGGLAGSGALGGIPGLAVTAAGAAGLGLIIGAMENISAESEEMKARVSENFQQMASEGVEAWESTQSQMQRLTDAYDQHEDEIRKIAELTGLTFETVAGAWAGNADDIAVVNGAYAELQGSITNVSGITVEAANAQREGWERIMSPLNNTLDGYDKARRKAEALERQQDAMWRGVIADAGTAQVEVDKFGNELYTLPDGQQVVIRADTKRASQNLDSFKGDLDGVARTTATAKVRVTVDDRAWRNWRPGTKVGRVDARVGGRDTYDWR